METITSRQNPLCTHLRKLSSSAAYRRQCGEFLCDSPKLLQEALLWGSELHTVVVTAGTEAPPLPKGVRLVEVPADVMKSVSPMETPQGTLFICAIHTEPLPEMLAGRRYVVLDTLQDPGNVGTILRTADAFHADGMFLVNGCADLYNPKTLRATMGAVFRCPVWTVGAEELSALLKKSGIPLYGAALRESGGCQTGNGLRNGLFSKAAAPGTSGGGPVSTPAGKRPMHVHPPGFPWGTSLWGDSWH